MTSEKDPTTLEAALYMPSNKQARSSKHMRINIAIITGVVFQSFLAICLIVRTSRGHAIPNTTPSNGNVGFHLTTAYATAAIAYADGTATAISRVEVDEEYKSMMYRLSLNSSRHIQTPYQSFFEGVQDRVGDTARSSRKAIGLPTSADVGTLSKVITELRNAVEVKLVRKISAAALTGPNLVGLYEESLRDAFAYSRLDYVDIYPHSDQNRIQATRAFDAGQHFAAAKPGSSASEHSIIDAHDGTFVLTVEYTRNSLITSLVQAYGHSHTAKAPHFANFTLGHDASDEMSDHWENVREMIQKSVRARPISRKISTVLVQGDCAENPKFIEVLREAVTSFCIGPTSIFLGDPIFSAAKGAAESGRRALVAERSKGLVVEDTLGALHDDM